MSGYKRYELLKDGSGNIKSMPFINIPERQSDKYIRWKVGTSRLDRISNIYYGSPEFGFLILYGNKKYIDEWSIEDGSIIRIPFPLQTVLEDYESILKSLVT